MWNEGRELVKEVFFQDEIELYVNSYLQNDIGESIEDPELVGTYPCNIQNGASAVQSSVGGQSVPQGIRISTVKDLPFDYEHTYQVRIKSARIKFDPDEMWKVDNILEAQLSTVITASRKILV